jgi:hypothetical protein
MSAMQPGIREASHKVHPVVGKPLRGGMSADL